MYFMYSVCRMEKSSVPARKVHGAHGVHEVHEVHKPKESLKKGANNIGREEVSKHTGKSKEELA